MMKKFEFEKKEKYKSKQIRKKKTVLKSTQMNK